MASKLSLVLLLLAASGCAAASPRFPLRAPLSRDPDQQPFEGAPEEYYSPWAWDGANYMLFYPLARVFALDPAGPAANVNAADEVPNSSWFENRLGARPMSAEEAARGSCGDALLDPDMPDGSWTIDRGKDNGANPGFRVNAPGLGKFMVKPDQAPEPERGTGATAIVSRIYHDVGYFSTCDSVIYFRPSLLKIKPGLTTTNNEGVTKPFDQAALDRVLSGASRRDGLIRASASRWLPGKTLGPFRYQGTRDDDPNDVIPHEDRRELRGARLLAAWLNHFDSREENTMDVFLPREPNNPSGAGYVRHYVMDYNDSFGSLWWLDSISRRLGFAYMFDGYVPEDFITLGAIRRPWERAQRTGGPFFYFSARDFDPETWRGEYPNPAFIRMTEQDGAWMTRILASFSDELVAAVVRVGKYQPDAERYLTQTLIARRDAILRRYLGKVSPIARVTADSRGLCAVDLARLNHIVPSESLSLRAHLYRGAQLTPSPVGHFRAVSSPQLCLDIPHGAFRTTLPEDAAERYLIVDITNGYAEGPLRAHLYDLGEQRGYRLAGIERPEDPSPPH